MIDVSGLPTIGFRHRDPLWWAVMLLIAIEGTMLVLLSISYLYVRERVSPWPPTLSPRAIAWMGAGELALLLASIAPMLVANRGALDGSVPKMRWGLVGTLVFAAGWAVLRVLVFDALPFRWDDGAYGSVVWAMLVIHTLHMISGVGENATFAVLMFVGPVEEKHRVDVNVTTPLWFFVVAGEALLFVVVYLEMFLTGVP